MKGIYLTEQGKKAIEDKIAKLKSETFDETYEEGIINTAENMGKISVLKEILASAIILSVEKDYGYIQEKYFDEIKKDDSPDTKLIEILQENFRNGVIIQPKQ